ncbi:MAG: TIR domain-containing protein [Syntrophobacteraceae bacterium]
MLSRGIVVCLTGVTMYFDMVPILADALVGYYEEREISELCDLYGIDLNFEGGKPAYMRLARDLWEGIENSGKRRFLAVIIESLLNRAMEGAAKSYWDRQEYHRAMVENLRHMKNELERIAQSVDDSGELLVNQLSEQPQGKPGAQAEAYSATGVDPGVRTPLQVMADAYRDYEQQIQKAGYNSSTETSQLQPQAAGVHVTSPEILGDQEVKHVPDRRQVFVVHGRDDRLRRDFFSFLRALDILPLEWSEALRLTGKAAPYIGEVLDKAFDSAQAIVVLLTPDDEVRLAPELWLSDEEDAEKELRLQARPNVLFEAGMAFGRNPDRTLLVQVGQVKAFSDVAGRHVVRLTNAPESRQDVAERLRTVGCAVSTSGSDWLRQGDFSAHRGDNQPASQRQHVEPTVKWVDFNYPKDVGILAGLQGQGYRIGWCSEDALARRLDIEGWSLVTRTTESGQNIVLKMKDKPHNQVLIMKWQG